MNDQGGHHNRTLYHNVTHLDSDHDTECGSKVDEELANKRQHPTGRRSPLLLLIFLFGALACLFISSRARPGDDPYDSEGEIASDYVHPSRYNSTVLQQRADPPPLSSLLNTSIELEQGGCIIGSVEWLLDFSIIGFPKCGTSSLKRWLNTSSSIYLDGYEVNGLSNNKPNRVIKHLHQVVSSLQPEVKIGIKNPTDLESSLHYYRRYFPNTQLLVLLRHPVHWFQSFYNFRRRKYHRLGNTSTIMPPLEHLIGKCHKLNDGVCTDRARFHHAISRLGLTPLNTTKELALLDNLDVLRTLQQPTNQKVFFLEVNQMKDANDDLRRDLQLFLGVDDLPSMPPHHNKTYGRVDGEIDICDVKYTEVRKILVEHGRQSSQWIVDYLLASNRVVVSSRHQFIDHLNAWKTDPCLV